MRRLLPIFVLGAFLVGGCKQNGADDATPMPSAGGKVPGSDEVPAELRNDAYDYYGLGNKAPIDLQMVSTYGGLQMGTRVTRLVKVANGQATFEIEHTGGLERLGVSTYVLTMAGLYAEKISIGTFTPGNRIEVPARLTPGAKWGGPITLKLNTGQTIKTNLIYQVVGPEKIKTKAGTFDSMLVKATSVGTTNGKKANEAIKIWLVKGVGPVKIEMKQTVGKDSGTSSIEATKVPK